jgi:hypothetical protein
LRERKGGSAVKILHFSDAHIDIISQGKLDSKSGLPIRTLDFLKALDQIVDAAIDERVDLVYSRVMPTKTALLFQPISGSGANE